MAGHGWTLGVAFNPGCASSILAPAAKILPDSATVSTRLRKGRNVGSNPAPATNALPRSVIREHPVLCRRRLSVRIRPRQPTRGRS